MFQNGSPKSRYILLLASVAALVVLGVVVLVVVTRKPTNNVNSNPSTNVSVSTDSLFGAMLAYNINDAASKTPGTIATLQNGYSELKKDGSAYSTFRGDLVNLIRDRTKLVKTAGFSLDRELVPYFTWNIIEPEKGRFDWDLTDLYAQATSNAGVKVSAVIQPFASWDQLNSVAPTNCKALDFAYYDYKVGPPKDIAEYKNFITKTVDRYKDRVAVWEIGNEYDGPCGGYEDNPQGYLDLVKISSETIKSVDPQAVVTNGAASEVVGNGPGTSSVRNFWTKFFALGGGQFINYFNFHYNTERSQDAKLNPATFQEAATYLNNLMASNGGEKPLYLTEFGIYSGSPSSQPGGQTSPGQPPASNKPTLPSQGGPVSPPTSAGQSLSTVSQDSQAALYFKDSVLAFANGVKLVFVDLVGPDGGLVGSSMAFGTDGQPRQFLATLKTIASKVDSFSKVEKIADSQYKFTVGGKKIYALWAGTIPSEITGKVKVTDIRGQEQTTNASRAKPDSSQPIFVEQE